MAKTYTYDDFMRELEKSGLGGQFSQADLNLARNNPDAGMSLISYKTDYANATTPELRALANQGAESIRSSYGGYTGGGDGGSFRLNPMSPNQFTYDEAPSFTDNYADRIEAALAAQQNRTPYSYEGAAPTYESRYDPQIQETIAGILGRGEFSYDPKTDPVYSSYQKQYAREGQRATANAMGEAAAMTGGQPSSWAMTAASQAGDYYASQMADKIPELYQDAYNRYLQEYQMKLSDLSALRGLESDDYGKYRDQLSQYNTDRSFDYARWLDEQQLGQQDLENLRALRSDDLDLYRTELGQYNTDRSFDYGQWLDEITNQRTAREDQRNWAQQAAQYGDFSQLNALGIDTSTAQRREALSEAMQAAEAGDYSLLAALGIDVTNAQLMQQLEQAYKQAQISSVYANMRTEEERALDNEYRRAQIASLKNKESSGSGNEQEADDDEYAYFNTLTPKQQADFAERAHKMGDDTYYRLLGVTFPEAEAAGEQGGDSGIDLNTVFASIVQAKRDGADEVKTRADAKRTIESIPGYDASVMDAEVEAFLDSVYSPKKTVGGTRISSN